MTVFMEVLSVFFFWEKKKKLDEKKCQEENNIIIRCYTTFDKCLICVGGRPTVHVKKIQKTEQGSSKISKYVLCYEAN